MPDPWGPLLLLLVLIFVKAWFTAAEAALMLLNEAKMRQAAEDGDKAAARLLKMSESSQIRSTIQVFVTAATLFSAVLAAQSFTDDMAQLTGCNEIVSLVLVTLILSYFVLVLGTQLPKQIGIIVPEHTARASMALLQVTAVLLSPITWILSLTDRLWMRMLAANLENAEEEVTEEDIRLMVDMGEEIGAIEETEKEMIENIFEFNNLTAENVMTHRTDVTSIWVDEEWDEVLNVIRETGLSRFPVYNEDRDDIIGTLNTRVFLLNMQAETPRSMREMLREAYFVPETVQADQLFRDMQTKKVHMAIVVDEYGGMSGIVTMEDLLEEIVGNIYDEFDPQAEAEIVCVDENTWRISGQAALEDVSEALNVELPLEEDYDTLGGLIFSQFTTIPEDGSTPELECFGLHIQVELIDEHRIETVLVKRMASKEETDQKSE